MGGRGTFRAHRHTNCPWPTAIHDEPSAGQPTVPVRIKGPHRLDGIRCEVTDRLPHTFSVTISCNGLAFTALNAKTASEDTVISKLCQLNMARYSKVRNVTLH